MDNVFVVPTGGLAQGRTEFSARALGEFFKSFGNQDILDADLDVEIAVEKSGRYFGIDIDIRGSVTVECDRCTYPLSLDVDVPVRLSVKFGTPASGGEIPAEMAPEGGREIFLADSAAGEIDLGQTVYDFVCTSLPLRRVHPDGQCDPETVKYLSQSSEEPSSSPFAALKGLIDNNN